MISKDAELSGLCHLLKAASRCGAGCAWHATVRDQHGNGLCDSCRPLTVGPATELPYSKLARRFRYIMAE